MKQHTPRPASKLLDAALDELGVPAPRRPNFNLRGAVLEILGDRLGASVHVTASPDGHVVLRAQQGPWFDELQASAGVIERRLRGRAGSAACVSFTVIQAPGRPEILTEPIGEAEVAAASAALCDKIENPALRELVARVRLRHGRLGGNG